MQIRTSPYCHACTVLLVIFITHGCDDVKEPLKRASSRTYWGIPGRHTGFEIGEIVYTSRTDRYPEVGIVSIVTNLPPGNEEQERVEVLKAISQCRNDFSDSFHQKRILANGKDGARMRFHPEYIVVKFNRIGEDLQKIDDRIAYLFHSIDVFAHSKLEDLVARAYVSAPGWSYDKESERPKDWLTLTIMDSYRNTLQQD